MDDIKELTGQMQKAIEDGDYKAVGKIAKDIANMQAADEKAAESKRQEGLAELTQKVLNAIAKTVEKFAGEIEEAKGDGVWYSLDNVEKTVECRLIKRKARKAGAGGGGGGKRFPISTNDMLAKHGDTIYKDGISFTDAMSATSDKNARFTIRKSLLKLEGLA